MWSIFIAHDVPLPTPLPSPPLPLPPPHSLSRPLVISFRSSRLIVRSPANFFTQHPGTRGQGRNYKSRGHRQAKYNWSRETNISLRRLKKYRNVPLKATTGCSPARYNSCDLTTAHSTTRIYLFLNSFKRRVYSQIVLLAGWGMATILK